MLSISEDVQPAMHHRCWLKGLKQGDKHLPMPMTRTVPLSYWVNNVLTHHSHSSQGGTETKTELSLAAEDMVLAQDLQQQCQIPITLGC